MISDFERGQRLGPRRPIWLTVAFSVVAGGLGLAGALTRPVWHDELYTLWLARMPLADLLAALEVDSGPPLHYLICHALYSIVGWQEGSSLGTLMVRLPSVAAFAMMPWVLWRWARDRNEVFFWASALTIAWLPMLYFATEARAYALLALVNAVLWLLGPELVSKGGSRLMLFATLAAALPMVHYAGLFSFIFLPFIGFFVPRSHWRSFAFALGAAALPLLAWSPKILGAPEKSMAWVDIAAGPGRPGLATIQALAPSGPFPALFENPASPVLPWLSVSVFAALVGAAIAGSRLQRTSAGEGASGPNDTKLLAVGLLPVVCLALVALAGWPVYFAGRTESMVWVLAVTLTSIMVLPLPTLVRRTVTGAYLLFGSMTVVLWLSSMPMRPPAPGVEVGRALASVIQQDDRVIVVGLWQLEVQYGLAESRLAGVAGTAGTTGVETIPHSQAQHPGWLDLDAVTSENLIDEARKLESESRKGANRIWLIWSPGLPLERTLIPAFVGWERVRVVDDPLILVDLFAP